MTFSQKTLNPTTNCTTWGVCGHCIILYDIYHKFDEKRNVLGFNEQINKEMGSFSYFEPQFRHLMKVDGWGSSRRNEFLEKSRIFQNFIFFFKNCNWWILVIIIIFIKWRIWRRKIFFSDFWKIKKKIKNFQFLKNNFFFNSSRN